MASGGDVVSARDVDTLIAAIEAAVTTAERYVDDARDQLEELRQMIANNEHDPDMPSPAAEKQRLEEWNRMARAS
jgi:cell division septum initiation protein DivIVA